MLELTGLGKRFGAITALSDVNFSLLPGEVHVLFGENGAGKSTLINIIAGTVPPSSGTRHFQQQDITGLSIHETRALGIVPVFQEFSLIPSLSVQANLFLGRELTRAGGWLHHAAMRARAKELLASLDFAVDTDALVATLSRAQQQMIEIAKALLIQPKVLILDEPTASLTETETQRLFQVVETLREQGVGIIYVSHRMPEIRRLADRITVLRNGSCVTTVQAADASDERLVEWMTGKKNDARYPVITHRPTTEALRIHHLSLHNQRCLNASIHVNYGEIVGIAGLVGCGKSELARACFGLEHIRDGHISLKGATVHKLAPDRLLRQGVCYFPSDRNGEGLALGRPIRENASLAALDTNALSQWGVLNATKERHLVEKILQQITLRGGGLESGVEVLSGGNRQKVMLARGLMRDIDIFIFDEPTVGIDVGAKYEVYELIRQLVERGAAVIIVSSELPEIVNLSHRVYVMREGQVTAHLQHPDISEQNILPYFFHSHHSTMQEVA